jgi:hypothetical protein
LRCCSTLPHTRVRVRCDGPPAEPRLTGIGPGQRCALPLLRRTGAALGARQYSVSTRVAQDGWNATSKKCKGDSKCIFKGAPVPSSCRARSCSVRCNRKVAMQQNKCTDATVYKCLRVVPGRQAPRRVGERQAGVCSRLPALRVLHRRLSATRMLCASSAG